jgi:nucleoid-associated protein YgaU
MNATSIARIVVPSLALVATCGTAAWVFETTRQTREAPLETVAAIPPARPQPAASDVPDEGSAAAAEAEVRAAAPQQLALAPPAPATDDSSPVFDIAHIAPTGDAVIAGRAAPGATVELLRNGERHDRAIADQSGEFVMIPPRLPPGSYELTLRAELPTGTVAVSKHSVAVALNAPSPNAGQAHAEAPPARPDAASQVQASHTETPQGAVSQSMRVTAATPQAGGGSSSSEATAKRTMRIVSRGDSLWSISRLAYGAGTQYALIYRANREHIRNPDRIYPGQTFILPRNAR